MKKMELITKVEKILKESGFSNHDYVISLQGPTVIFAITGKEKFEKDPIVRAEILHTGIQILT